MSWHGCFIVGLIAVISIAALLYALADHTDEVLPKPQPDSRAQLHRNYVVGGDAK